MSDSQKAPRVIDLDALRLPCVVTTIHGCMEHGSWTSMLALVEYPRLGAGWTQGFGGLSLNTPALREAWERELAQTFGVERYRDIAGKLAYALYSEARGRHVEGIESKDTGTRFTVLGFQRRHAPESAAAFGIGAQRARLVAAVEQAEREVERARLALDTIDSRYHEWEDTL